MWAAVVAALLLAPLSARADDVLDLTSPSGASGTLNGATFETNFNQPTGTGVIQSFVRMQASNNTFESGFNTDAQKPPLDDLAGNFTHAVQLSDLKQVNGQYVFFLDANQQAQNGGLPAAGLSLLQLQIYTGDTGTPTTNPFGDNGGFPMFQGFSSPSTLVYDMDGPGSTNNMVNLNTGINNGSGSGDLTVSVDASLFGSDLTKFVYLYSSFGIPDPNGQIAGATYYGNNDGFEEWSALLGENSPRAVPEPSTIALTLSGLVSAGFVGLRRLRRRQAATV